MRRPAPHFLSHQEMENKTIGTTSKTLHWLYRNYTPFNGKSFKNSKYYFPYFHTFISNNVNLRLAKFQLSLKLTLTWCSRHLYRLSRTKCCNSSKRMSELRYSSCLKKVISERGEIVGLTLIVAVPQITGLTWGSFSPTIYCASLVCTRSRGKEVSDVSYFIQKDLGLLTNFISEYINVSHITWIRVCSQCQQTFFRSVGLLVKPQKFRTQTKNPDIRRNSSSSVIENHLKVNSNGNFFVEAVTSSVVSKTMSCVTMSIAKISVIVCVVNSLSCSVLFNLTVNTNGGTDI